MEEQVDALSAESVDVEAVSSAENDGLKAFEETTAVATNVETVGDEVDPKSSGTAYGKRERDPELNARYKAAAQMVIRENSTITAASKKYKLPISSLWHYVREMRGEKRIAKKRKPAYRRKPSYMVTSTSSRAVSGAAKAQFIRGMPRYCKDSMDEVKASTVIIPYKGIEYKADLKTTVCVYCNTYVNWTRPRDLQRHCATSSHKSNKLTHVFHKNTVLRKKVKQPRVNTAVEDNNHAVFIIEETYTYAGDEVQEIPAYSLQQASTSHPQTGEYCEVFNPHTAWSSQGSNNIHATLYNVESNFPILRELKKNPIQHYIISFERAAELVRILPNTPPRQLVNMILVNHQYMKKRAILCIFLRRYYLKRYIISRLLTVEDIQADPELKAIYEEGVNTYINDPDITMEQVASNLGFHQSVFRTYMSETRPTFAVEKREHARPTEDPLEAIKRDPEMKTKYDKAVAAYVRLEVSSMSKAASDAGVKLPLFKLYLHKECPDHQEKRAAAITANITLPNKDFLHRYRERLKNMMNMDSVKYMRKQNDGSSYCDLCMCRIRGQKAADLLDHYDSVRHQNSLRSLGETDNLRHEYNNDPLPPPPTPPLDPTEQHVILLQAPKDPSAADNSTWAAQSQASSSRGSKEMSPRPSTSSAAHVGGFMIKPDPGTPPPTQPVLSPYVQEPPMVAPAPRLMPKPTPPPQSLIQQQTPRLRVRQPPPQVVAPPPPPPPDPEAQQVCLRWNSFHNNMQTMFPSLLSREKFVDVTLACDGRSIKCHKVVLSSCSSYLERLLTDNPCKHPIILMPRDMRYWQVRALVDFMYRGEVNVEHEQLASLLSAAEFLQVKGLAGPSSSTDTPMSEDIEPEPPMSPRPKRKRVASPSPSPAPQPHSQQPPPPPPPLQQQHTRQQQQHHVQRTSSPTLPNSPAVSITRLRHSASSASAASSSQHSPSAVATASTSRDPSIRAQSPGIEITPVVSFEEIKVEPIDISDSNDESMDPSMQHCSVDYDMDNGDVDKDYQDDDDLDGDSGDGDNTMAEDDTGGGDMDVPGSSHGDDGAGSDVTAAANGPAVTGGATVATPSFSGNGLDIDDAAYSASELGLRTEPNEDPPDAIAGPSTEDA